MQSTQSTAWSINEEEIAYYVGKKSIRVECDDDRVLQVLASTTKKNAGERMQKTVKSIQSSLPSSYEVYIPKIQPAIRMAEAKTTPVTLDSSCFCNSSSCRVKASSQIKTQNYIVVQPKANQTFEYMTLSKFGQCAVKCVSGSLDQLYLSDVSDPTSRSDYGKS